MSARKFKSHTYRYCLESQDKKGDNYQGFFEKVDPILGRVVEQDNSIRLMAEDIAKIILYILGNGVKMIVMKLILIFAIEDNKENQLWLLGASKFSYISKPTPLLKKKKIDLNSDSLSFPLNNFEIIHTNVNSPMGFKKNGLALKPIHRTLSVQPNERTVKGIPVNKNILKPLKKPFQLDPRIKKYMGKEHIRDIINQSILRLKYENILKKEIKIPLLTQKKDTIVLHKLKNHSIEIVTENNDSNNEKELTMNNIKCNVESRTPSFLSDINKLKEGLRHVYPLLSIRENKISCPGDFCKHDKSYNEHYPMDNLIICLGKTDLFSPTSNYRVRQILKSNYKSLHEEVVHSNYFLRKSTFDEIEKQNISKETTENIFVERLAKRLREKIRLNPNWAKELPEEILSVLSQQDRTIVNVCKHCNAAYTKIAGYVGRKLLQ